MNLNHKKRKILWGQVGLHTFFILLCVCYVYPLLLLICVSFEGHPQASFSLEIKQFTTQAYQQIFSRPERILKAYGVTFFYSTVATLGSLVVMSMFAYALSKRDFKARNVITFLLFFTTLFSGGLVPSYLVNSTLLHLDNKIWIYIIPSLMNAWNVIVLRTFFQGLPEGLHEAARIDGASELRICFQIVIPLSMPALASIGFLAFIGHWNNWFTTSIYIRDLDLYSLQYMLKLYLDSATEVKKMMQQGFISQLEAEEQLKNLESLRFAMAIVAAGPMLFVFPFFQKYFAKGLTLGSVKG